jgi:hypothetical protein
MVNNSKNIIRGLYVLERGGYTNVLLQYLFASKLSDLFGNLLIFGQNSHRLTWVRTCASRPILAPSIPLQDPPISEVLDTLQQFAFVSFKYRNVPSQLEMLPDWTRSNYLIPHFSKPTYLASDRELLINVRGSEILGDCHPDYGPVPINFLVSVVQDTGLDPVFLGQLGNDYYSKALKRVFPSAKFISSGGADSDFEAIRSAHHILPSVSTFSWLATWLSKARSIHLPVLGMLNPLQRQDTWFLPLNEPRYHFYQFPIRYWEASNEQKQDVLSGANTPRMIHRSELDRLNAQNQFSRMPLRSAAVQRLRSSSDIASKLRFLNSIKVAL